jgi:hypothetical protein
MYMNVQPLTVPNYPFSNLKLVQRRTSTCLHQDVPCMYASEPITVVIILSTDILFNFDLSYINNLRKFYCDNSIYVYSVPWTSSPPPLYFQPPFFSSPFARGRFHYVYIWSIHPSSHPSISFPFSLPLLVDHPLKTLPHIHSCPIVIITTTTTTIIII